MQDETQQAGGQNRVADIDVIARPHTLEPIETEQVDIAVQLVLRRGGIDSDQVLCQYRCVLFDQRERYVCRHGAGSRKDVGSMGLESWEPSGERKPERCARCAIGDVERSESKRVFSILCDVYVCMSKTPLPSL